MENFDDEFGDLSGYKILSFGHGIQESKTQPYLKNGLYAFSKPILVGFP